MLSISVFRHVAEFHHKFGMDAHVPETPSEITSPELLNFRIKFLQEELEEYITATTEGDLPKMVDALIDLIYVAAGTLHLHGLPPAASEAVFQAVQVANMAKVRAQRVEDSARGSVFDIVKPEGWTPPDVGAILKKYGWVG